MVWLDAGSWSDNLLSPDGLIKTKALLSGMSEIGYAAANVAERDLAAGLEPFLDRKKEAAFPMVSANLVFSSSGKPITDPYILLKLEPKKFPALKSPLRIAITGVTRFNPTFMKSAPPKDNVVITPPADALKKYLPEMKKKADQVIVLAAMPRDDAHLLVKELPGIDLVLGAFGGMTTAVEEKEGATAIFYCGTQGKYLAELRMLRHDNLTELKSSLHYLNAQYPTDPSMQAKVDAALAEINNRNKAVTANGNTLQQGSAAAAEPEGKSFVTSEACRQCHAVEYAVWEGSKHAHAMDILVEKKAEYNPECVGCHVLGFKRRDGFVDLKTTAAFANVHCESCHGAGARHVQNPNTPYGRLTPLACLRCHTKENSPSFEYNAYWAKIKHGK